MGLGLEGERDTQIVVVELIAPVIALYTWKDFILGRTVIMSNDNTIAESILVKGYRNNVEDANKAVGEFWKLAAENYICVYIDRVPTDCNPSDGASRGKAHEDAMQFGWELCRARIDPEWEERGPGTRDGLSSVTHE